MSTTTISGAGAHASTEATDRFPASKAGVSGYNSGSSIKTYVETGTATNDNASTGQKGEYVSSTVAKASGVSLTSPNAANVTSISLTAGDWDVGGNVGFDAAGTTTMSTLGGSINTASATMGVEGTVLNLTFTTGTDNKFTVPTIRLSLAATTTVYLVAQGVFATSTLTTHGVLWARRAR
jgi:hypothetical protein